MTLTFWIPTFIDVPNVYNMTQAAAESAITSLGLVVGTVDEDYNETIIEGNVYNQSPVAGTKLKIGATVNLDVSLGAEEVIEDTYFTVAADADDGYARPGSTPLLNTTHVVIGYKYDMWLRFTNLPIPNGATINSAFLRVTQHGSEGTRNVDCIMYARDHGNSGNPTLPENILNADPTSPGSNGWTLTTGNTHWDNIPGDYGGWSHDSPSIISTIQEVINRGDWSSSNALCVVILDNNSVHDREWDDFADPKPVRLYVSYTYTPVLYDGFTGSNGAAWDSMWQDTYPTANASATILDNKGVMQIDSGTSGNHYLENAQKLTGDFDFQADIVNATGRSDTDQFAGIYISDLHDSNGNKWAAVSQRLQGTQNSIYFRYNNMSGNNSFYSYNCTGPESVGTYRLIRSGSELTAYYYDAGWQILGTSQAWAADDIYFGYVMWRYGTAPTLDYKLTTDNFTIAQGTLIAP